MKTKVLHLFVSPLCIIVFLLTPLTATAEGQEDISELPLPTILITEVQTGAGVTGQAGNEFIELYNTTDETIDLTDWQLRYVSATATTVSIDNPSFKVDITPPITDGIVQQLAPGAHYILRTETMAVSGQVYAGNLTASGSLILFGPTDPLTCERTAIDAVAWKAGLLGDGSAVPIPDTKDRLLVRFVDAQNEYIYTRDNLHDFGAFNPNPPTLQTIALKNTQVIPANAPVTPEPTATTGTTVAEPSCTIPDPEPDPPIDPPGEDSPPSITDPEENEDEGGPVVPAGNIGLKPPQISELLPNPASPQKDASDEFIELYNPNASNFDLSGYVLEVGITTKRKYTFPTGTMLPAKTFVAFFSEDTNVSLSNTGSAVRLIDPLDVVLTQSEQYTNAKDGQAWILANGTWQWTTAPTPNAINHVRSPVAKKKATKAKQAAAVKSANSSKKEVAAQEDAQQFVAATTATNTPLHPGVLAAVGVFAVLYGAYEYRHDLANKIRIFRTNRAARRAAR